MTNRYTDNEMSKISRAEYKRGISEEKARWKKKIEKIKEVSFDNKGKPDDYIKGYSDAFWNFDKLIDKLLGDGA